MNPIAFALRRPITIVMMVVGVVLGGGLGLSRMPIDIFPSLNMPQIYIVCNYGGMDPGQMEGLIANVYELHFQYVEGVKGIESRNIQNATMVKLTFYPGTNMPSAMASTVSMANRALAQMPPGTLPPFVMRFDAGTVPIGYVVLSSKTHTLGQMQDLMMYRIRPLFAASIPGTVSMPPFGANVRAIVINVDPDRLRSYHLSPDDVVSALSAGNVVSPSGNLYIKDQMPIAKLNAMVVNPKELEKIPLRLKENVYIRDIGRVEDSTDVPCGYALVDGQKSIYMPVVKRDTASTLTVVADVRKALPQMSAVLPPGIDVSYRFDESPTVRQSIQTVGIEGFLGAGLTGLMVLLFLRDWRSVIVVVTNIPLAVLASILGLWLTGNTINIMTLGGLALAIGILVDEATVFVENIHAQLEGGGTIARAVRRAYSDTAVPRFLAMLCILSVFIPAFVMEGPIKALFLPLTLAVGFAMIASFLLSSTIVPVLAIWILRKPPHEPKEAQPAGWFSFAAFQNGYARIVRVLVASRWLVIPVYLVVAGILLWQVGERVGQDMFPHSNSGQFKLRLRAPEGTYFELTRAIATKVLDEIAEEVGPENVEISLGYVGALPPMYAINSLFLWMRGPDDGMIRVALRKEAKIALEPLKERLRRRLPDKVIPWLADRMIQSGVDPQVARTRAKRMTFGFEPGDIVGQVMSFGSPTPIEVLVTCHSLPEARKHAEAILKQLEKIDSLRDLQFQQSLDYPTVNIEMDREKAGLSGLTTAEMGRSLVAATYSSRYVVENYWKDEASGSDYQVQVQILPQRMDSVAQAATIPVDPTSQRTLLVRDVADVSVTTSVGEFDRRNMQRFVSISANVHDMDLGTASNLINKAIADAGAPPRGVTVELLGQIAPMREMFMGLGVGLAMAVVVILVLLTAYFQSFRLAIVSLSTLPAVVTGVAIALWSTKTTLNIESFMGSIMCIGVATSNAIMLVTFADRFRREGIPVAKAAVDGAAERLRPILMTSCAMVVGMLPMALALEDGGDQTAPLGRAVIGGLLASTLAALLILPCVFTALMGRSSIRSPSLDPDDPESGHFDAPSNPMPEPTTP